MAFVFLIGLSASASFVQAGDYKELNYQVHRKKDSVGWGVYFKPMPGFTILPGPSDTPLLRFPLEPVLKSSGVTTYWNLCQLSDFEESNAPVSDSSLATNHTLSKSVQGDWDADGDRDLFFISKAHFVAPPGELEWCGFQLVNRITQKPLVISDESWVDYLDAKDPYNFENVDHMDARDLNGDGRDDLLVFYNDGTASSFTANDEGELFGEGSVSAPYVPPTQLSDDDVAEADVLPRVVGAIGGSHTVGVDGSASYSIPIAAPAAAGGMQPGIALGYSSTGGNGSLGFGWQLGGLSRIHRCGKTEKQDGIAAAVNFSVTNSIPNDQLCLDGQRLVLHAGTHGAANSEYRLENELFIKVKAEGTQGNMPASFSVYSSDGSVASYATAILAGEPNDNQVLEWAITSAADRSGNSRAYTYHQDAGIGSYRIEKIAYGGNGTNPSHTHSVEFKYSQRPNGFYGYMSASLMTNPDMLTDITVYEGIQRLRFYSLKYRPALHNNVMYLQSVTECSGAEICLQPTVFEWAQPSSGFGFAETALTRTDTGMAMVSDSAEEPPNQVPQHEFWIDMNGDAKADRVWKPATGGANAIQVALSTTPSTPSSATTFAAPQPWLSNSLGGFSNVSLRGVRETFSDMNGDGLPDYVWQPADKNNDIYIAINNGGGGFTAPTEAALSGSNLSVKLYFSVDITNQKNNGLFEAFVDVNGDGRVDKVWRPSGKDSYYVVLAKKTSIGFDPPVKAYDSVGAFKSFSYKGERETYADVTGDGLPDRVWFPKVGEAAFENEESGTKLYVAVNAGNAINVANNNAVEWQGFHPATPWLTNTPGDGFSTISTSGRREGYADFNADGLADRWWLYGTDPTVKLYVALSNGKSQFMTPTVWLQDFNSAGVNINSNYSKSNSFMDVNDDGYIDLVWRPSDHPHQLWVAQSTGRSFMAPQRWLDNASAGVTLTSASAAYESFADVDGDGLADRVWIPNDGDPVLVNGVSYNQSGGKIAVSRNLATRSSELVKVTNGFGHETIFNYKPLTDSDVYSKNDPDIDALSNEAHKPRVVDAQRVVQSVDVSNGIGDYARTSYRYAGMRFNTQTRELLGFAKIVVSNEVTGFSDTTIYSQNDAANQQGLILQTSTKYQSAPNVAPILLSDTVNTWQVDVLPDNVISANKRFMRKLLTTTITKNDLAGDGLYNESNVYTYDGDGRIDVQTTTVMKPGGGILKTTTIDNEYLAPIVTSTWWIRGLPSRITVTENSTALANDGLSDPLPITKVSEWSYDATGRLQSENVMNGGAAALTTSYTEYNAFGHARKVTVGSGATVRSKTAVYSPDGRFVVGGVNALDESVGTSTYWPAGDGFGGGAYPGLLKESIDANGIVTRHYYDGFGRPTKTIAAFGTTAAVESNTAFVRCGSAATACPAWAVYAIRTTTVGGVESWSYLDVLGREVRQVAQGMSGGNIYVDRVYNARGNLEKVSDPTESATARVWNVMAYDARDRAISTTRGSDGRVDTVEYSGLNVIATINAGAGAESDTRTELKNGLGQVMAVKDKANNTLQYIYDSSGKLLETRDPANNITSITYNGLGQKTAMQDPDKGAWTYDYNSFGELVLQTNAKGQKACIVYDKLGRMVSRVDEYTGSAAEAANDCTNPGVGSKTATWTYGTAAPLFGKLTGSALADANEYSESRSYDNLGRLHVVNKTIKGQAYAYSTTYGNYSRPDVLTYPAVSGTPLAVKHFYNNLGFLTDIKDAANNALYYHVGEIDAKGRITEESFGNGVTTWRGFNDQANTRTITSSKGTIQIQGITAEFNKLGSLTRRADAVQGYEEEFEYDNLQRLTQVNGNFGSGDLRSQTQTYDNLGNILTKIATGTVTLTPATAITNVGTYNYGDCDNPSNSAQTRPHAVCSITDGASYTYDNNGNNLAGDGRATTYASFDLPTAIAKGGVTSNIAYGPDRNRYYREDNGGSTLTKTVQVDALYEKVTTTTGSVTDVEEKHYLGNFAVVTIKNRATTPERHTRYLHQDHLGSLTAITDEAGNVAELHTYDAWGKRTTPNPTTLANNHVANGWASGPLVALNQSTITNKGFTGHEMFDDVGIIHMNGRIYDPVLGKFLQADPIVQSPTDLQAYNRYAYVRNNPLTLTDPSGFSTLGDLWDDAKDAFEKVDPITSRILSELHEFNKSRWRETGRLFIKVPELQAVVNAVLACIPVVWWVIPLFNAGVSAMVTYQSGGDFGDSLQGAAIAFVASAVAGQLTGGAGTFSEGWSASQSFAASMLFSGAVSKSQGGKFFDARNLAKGLAIGAAVKIAMGSFVGQQAGQADVAGEGSPDANINSSAGALSAVGDVLGKVWNLPNTIIGLAYGGAGYVIGMAGYAMGFIDAMPGISFGNNAVQFTNNPLMKSAMTLGNVIVYGGKTIDDRGHLWDYSPSSTLVGRNGKAHAPTTLGNEEMQHTYQGQFLGPFYFPAHITGGVLSLMKSGSWHGHSLDSYGAGCQHGNNNPSPLC